MLKCEYLIRHGLLGDIGRFRSAMPLVLGRGDRVVIRGPRGTEIGEVVRAATAGGPGHGGELLRAADAEDVAKQARLRAAADNFAEESGNLARSLGLPVQVFEVEILLDERHAGVSFVGAVGVDLTPFRRQLEQRTGLLITWHDLTRPSVEESGCSDCGSGGESGSCGSGDCGSGGCSSGGCGSGGCGAAGAEDLREFLASAERRRGLVREQGRGRVALL